MIDQYREMFESRIFAAATEQLRVWENPHAKTVAVVLRHGRGHAQKCVDSFSELANKKTEQLYTVSTLCLDYHNFKMAELEMVAELIQCMFSNRPKLLVFWHDLGDHTFYGLSTNLLEQSENGQELVPDAWFRLIS